MPPRRTPFATYRVQFGDRFGFAAARRILPYLKRLGISHLYASPILTPRNGSTHGYDVADPHRVNPVLGSLKDFKTLVRALDSRGMGVILDIVPNHMSATCDNPWWHDLLEHGRLSPRARCFDIDWQSSDPRRRDRVVLPVLGRDLESALEAGELALEFDGNRFVLRAGGGSLPVAIASLGPVVSRALEALPTSAAAPRRALRSLQRRIEILAAPPPSSGRPTRAASPVRRADPIPILWRRERLARDLATLFRRSSQARRALGAVLRRAGADPDGGRDPDLLRQVLDRQHYRLVPWRAAGDAINYRRFFDINELVSLQIDDPAVFDARHAFLRSQVRLPGVDGVRVDHIDGLRDPLAYLRRLRQLVGPSCWIGVEKILAPGEPLPRTWPVEGTTGYDILVRLNGLFVDAAGLRDLLRIDRRFTGRRGSFSDLVYESKKSILHRQFSGEMRRLQDQLAILTRRDRAAGRISTAHRRRAFEEITCLLPVYRTYLGRRTMSSEDRAAIRHARVEARRRSPGLDRRALELVERLLTGAGSGRRRPAVERKRLALVRRWQQLTGPLMAKGHEDTALYLYTPLLSLNDVGGDPGIGATAPERFHRELRDRQRHYPGTLNAGATHDTKRGEDVRARLNVLSELPRLWERHLRRWEILNRPLKGVCGGTPVPHRREEVFIYQTLLGAWPASGRSGPEFRLRIRDYLVKASREAKAFTRWHEPDEQYEKGLTGFADRLLALPRNGPFMSGFLPFQRWLARAGAVNGLSQLLLRAAAPGVPDLYQGNEDWDLHLVDPDNRRPVDYRRRARDLAGLQRAFRQSPDRLTRRLLSCWSDGRIKLFLTWRALSLRQSHPDLFQHGDYLPLAVPGGTGPPVFAFARRHGPSWIVAAVPLRIALAMRGAAWPLGGATWGGRALRLPAAAPKTWRDALTHRALAPDDRRSLPLRELFSRLPLALLEGRTDA